MRASLQQPLTMLVIGTALTLMLLSASAGGGNEFGLAVGQKMPFHVVDFMAGPHKGGGCPSVMISNDKTRGIIIWTRTPDEKFLDLAKRLQVPLAKNPKAHA